MKTLTKFELSLWLTSIVVVTASFVFSGNSLLSIITSIIGVTALIFVAKGLVLGQVLTVVFAVFYGIVSYKNQYYGEMITYLCMTAPIAFLSVISWLKNPYKNTKVVKVSKVTKKQLILMSTLAIFVTLIFFFILKRLNNASLLFSTISITTSFIASYLTFLRSPYYAIGYAANDVILIILWVIASVTDIQYFPMVTCFIMFLINDLYGFINWKRIQKEQNKSDR